MSLIRLFAVLVIFLQYFHTGVQSLTFQVPTNQQAGHYCVPKANAIFQTSRCPSLSLYASLPVTNDEEISSDEEDEDEGFPSSNDMAILPEGIPKGFYVVQQYDVPESSLKDWVAVGLSSDVIERVD